MAGETKVSGFTLAVNRPFKTEEGEQQADFIQCQAWKNQAEFMEKYVHKGHLVAVQGSIRTRNYDKDGTTVYVTEVNVEQIHSLEKREAQSEDQIRKSWTDEYNKRKVGLDKTKISALKKELESKYQPRIDALTKPADGSKPIEDDLPF
jgi:single-strand DNA-binding protein